MILELICGSTDSSSFVFFYYYTFFRQYLRHKVPCDVIYQGYYFRFNFYQKISQNIFKLVLPEFVGAGLKVARGIVVRSL